MARGLGQGRTSPRYEGIGCREVRVQLLSELAEKKKDDEMDKKHPEKTSTASFNQHF